MHSLRKLITLLLLIIPALGAAGAERHAVVADSLTRRPLPSASVFDSRGKVIGVGSADGLMPYVSPSAYPVTVRYLGYAEKVVTTPCDTVFLRENLNELPVVTVEAGAYKVMHVLAYVREYSTLSTMTDTVFLFREKTVDYMLSPDKSRKFKGWTRPRILRSRSYYHFTDYLGRDSVSDKCDHHFSWSDWIGLRAVPLPDGLKAVPSATDTVKGRFSPAEVWTRNGDRVTVDIDILADTTTRRWVPNLSAFFKNYLDFENFRLRYSYDNIEGEQLTPMDVAACSFSIESRGRGREMFMFNRADEPFFVSTYAEIYILDKEYITVPEARKWEKRKYDIDRIYEPAEAPELQPAICELVDRVNNVDNDGNRLAMTPDHRLAGRNVAKQNFGQRLLQLFKTGTGISAYRSKKKWKNQWSDFRAKRRSHNNSTATASPTRETPESEQ